LEIGLNETANQSVTFVIYVQTCVLLQVRIVRSGDQLVYSTHWTSSVRRKRAVRYIKVVFYITERAA